jgi:hypothetical protein
LGHGGEPFPPTKANAERPDQNVVDTLLGGPAQLKEDAHRYRESNGVQILATLRSLAMNALRLDGFWSITEGLAALAHDIRGLLALLGWREPSQGLNSA